MNLKILLTTVAVVLAGFTLHAQDTAFKMRIKLTGHTASLEAVAYSPDGKLIASAGWDNNIQIYRADTPGLGNLEKKFTGHAGGITCLAWSRDGKYIASGSKDFTARVWDVATGRLFFMTTDHKQSITNVSFDPKSKFLMTSSLDGTIRMYDILEQANNVKPRFVPYSGPVNSYVTAIDGKTIYVAGNKTVIEQISFRAVVSRSLAGHSDRVNSVALSPDGKFLVSGSNDKTVIIWDLASGTALKKLTGHVWKVNSVSWSSDGKYVVSTGNEGETLVWDVESGKSIAKLKALGYNARNAVFNPSLTQIAVATMMEVTNHGVVLYSTPLKKAVPAPKTPKPVVTGGKPATAGSRPASTGTTKPR
jgi:WD40 repeat protein